MQSFLRKLPGFALPMLVFAGAAFAQTSQIEGKITGEDGQPLQNAMVKIERKDIRGNYQTKSNKKGQYLHAGLPLGQYKVTVLVDGKERDSMDNVRTRLGEPTVINFNLKEIADRQAAMQKAAETGQLTEEQSRSMSAEQKAALEKQVKERAQQMAKNKALNDAFNTGMEALKMKNYDVAIEQLTKAGELDPKQHVIWGNLADAYMNKSTTIAAQAERDALVTKGMESYQKAIELMPNDASYYNNYALALARVRKFDEMQAAIQKAIELDPAGAGKYYFNIGAILTNNGQVDAACNAFKKAIETDPNYADAHFQYAVCLSAKATAKPDGSIIYPEGMADSLQKYLALRPDGQYAQASKDLLTSMGQKIETQYIAPGAKKPTAPKKR